VSHEHLGHAHKHAYATIGDANQYPAAGVDRHANIDAYFSAECDLNPYTHTHQHAYFAARRDFDANPHA
jgi:hypothetical protein